MSKSLELDRTYLLGRENQVTDKISCTSRANLMNANYLSRVYPFLSSYHRYDLLLELSLQMFNLLTKSSEELLGPLRMQGHFSIAWHIT